MKLLGDILVDRNIASRKQVQQALNEQKRGNKDQYLGEILKQLGYVTDFDIMTALIIQQNLPYFAIEKYSVDKEILKLISKEDAIKHCVIPFAKVGDVLSIVMVDPSNKKQNEVLERLTKCHIAPFIATRDQIEEAINNNYL